MSDILREKLSDPSREIRKLPRAGITRTMPNPKIGGGQIRPRNALSTLSYKDGLKYGFQVLRIRGELILRPLLFHPIY